MKKSNVIIICILVVIIICLIGGLFYLNNYYVNQIDYIFYTTKVDETKRKKYDCSFTKTYRVVNLLDGYIAEVPDWSYIILDQFQNHSAIAIRIPSLLKNKLQENKYYEFTYTIKGSDKIISTMEDINKYLVLDESTADLKVTLNIKETDKQGLEQVQENICLPK